MAEKIVETAAEHGVPIYEDNSLATILTQLQLGQEIPENLYQAIVEIYVYFLHFDPATHSRRGVEPVQAAQKQKEETEYGQT
jgi:flagellar biosynthesis protein